MASTGPSSHNLIAHGKPSMAGQNIQANYQIPNGIYEWDSPWKLLLKCNYTLPELNGLYLHSVSTGLSTFSSCLDAKQRQKSRKLFIDL